MQTYDFAEFLREEVGGDSTGGTLDYVLGELLVFLAVEKPPKYLSFNTALVHRDVAKDLVQVGHDIYLDRSFEMSREDFTRAVKDAIASSREAGASRE